MAQCLIFITPIEKAMLVHACPTEVAPCRFDSLLLSGARIRETCAKEGMVNPSA